MLFLQHYIENTFHIFCICSKVQSYWEDVFAWISAKFRYPIIANNTLMLFGTLECKLLNCVLLCARYVIYKCKYSEALPTVSQFTKLVEDTRRSERLITLKNNKLVQHVTKWNLLI